MSFIEFRDVKKIYKMGEVEIPALAGVDFTIEKGEFVVIAGASGAGKSTILNLLGGMDTCTSGDISVDGRLVSKMNSRQLTDYRRYDIGFVFQFYNLVQNLTAKENVELAVQICKDPLDIDETIEAVGLKERKDNFPAQLSGGEQQRVAIARALALEPEILCFDEPTSALDPELTGEILKVIKGLAEQNRTMVIVTHEMSFASEISDKVIFMDDGIIAEEGSPAEVFDNPKNQRLREFLSKVYD